MGSGHVFTQWRLFLRLRLQMLLICSRNIDFQDTEKLINKQNVFDINM